MTMQTADLSPRSAALASCIVACAEAALCLPANDNAGLAWRLADDEPYTDDDRRVVEVHTRVARTIAPAVVEGVEGADAPARGWWRVGAEYRGKAMVNLCARMPLSRSVARRTRALVELLRAAGVTARLY